MRLLIPMAGALFALAACGGGDSPFVVTPSPTVSGTDPAPLAGTDTATPTATTSECEPTDYEVRDGDTLTALADTFGVTIDAIAEASDLEDPDVLAIGDPLTIPCPTEAPEETSEDGA
ncbi:MAG: LysM peptidoglycan-binding domain-containing protein [Chloroflexi bacterium]|nr:LysM peptidoglycan-binding domain-containing protein [Chloroflexota bacterium]